jgi:hypothetical protein
VADAVAGGVDPGSPLRQPTRISRVCAIGNSRVASRVPKLTDHDSLITGDWESGPHGVGRGCGVGRGRGVTLGVGLTVGVGVTLGVTLGVGVGVAVAVGVGVGVGVTEGVGVTVGVAVGVTVGVGVGVGPEGVMLKGPLVEELFWKRTSLAMTRSRTSAMPDDAGSCQS